MIPRFRPPHTFRDLGILLTHKKAKKTILDFENAFANAANQKYAKVFPYGRTALVATLSYLQTRANHDKKQVICPAYTCVVVAHAIIESGLEPVFVDSNGLTLNMDWDYVHQAVNNKTLAVISTSLFGNPTQEQKLKEFRLINPDIPIIQDCAHSFFAGGINRNGIAAIYGLNVSKIRTSLFGGMVTTDNTELSNWLLKYGEKNLVPSNFLRRIKRSLYLIGSLIAFSRLCYWFTFKLIRMNLLGKFVNYYDPNRITFPKDGFRQIGTVEAQLGKRQINTYTKEIERRTKLAQVYIEELLDLKGVFLPQFEKGSTYSHFPILVKNPSALRDRLQKQGIEIGSVIEYSIENMPPYSKYLYFGKSNSQKIRDQIVNLPIHRGINLHTVKKIVRCIKISIEV